MQYLNGKRYYTMAQYCKEKYGQRIVKIPFCSAFSCPNRDGSKGFGGCSFCSGDGGGEFSPKIRAPLSVQFKEGILQNQKWRSAVKMGYFQSFSNTHCSAEELYALLTEAAEISGISGIRLATRADCIDSQKADILFDFSKKLPIEIELGLQTVYDSTAERINRCHSFEEWKNGFSLLKERGLYVCAHLINGLPNETADMMINSAKVLGQLKIDGIKLHMLHIIKGSALAAQYQAQPFPLLSLEQYVDIICTQIAVLPPQTVIERLTGDAAHQTLIAPVWTANKRNVLNSIDKRLAELNIRQGDDFGG